MVTIYGRRYPIACDDGQEAHVTRLAEYIDKRLGQLASKAGPQTGEALLLVMTSILIADELTEAYDEMTELRAKAEGAEQGAKLGKGLEALAKRVEAMAARLENA